MPFARGSGSYKPPKSPMKPMPKPKRAKPGKGAIKRKPTQPRY